MNLQEILYLSWKNIVKKRFKSIIYILVIFLFSLLILIFFSGMNSLKLFIDEYLDSYFYFRMIAVNNEGGDYNAIMKEIEELNLPDVTKIFQNNSSLYIDPKITNHAKINGTVELYGAYGGINYKLVRGNKLENDNEMVCPHLFYPGLYLDLMTDELFDLNDRIGEYFDIEYVKKFVKANHESDIIDTFSRKMKLVGTYDVDAEYGSNNACYILPSALEKMNSESEDLYEDTAKYEYSLRHSEILLLIDEYKNVDKNLAFLSSKGYEVRQYYSLDTRFLDIALIIISILSVILTIISLLSVYIFIKNTLKENRKNVALYKVLGFNSHIIEKIVIMQYTILALVGFLLSIIMIIILREIASWIIAQYVLYRLLEIRLSFIEGILYFIVVLCSIFLSAKLYNKKNKDVPIRELMGE